MRSFFCAVLFLFATCSLQAQVEYPAFKSNTPVNPADSGKLSFSIYNMNYEYNTEWFGKIPNSGTWFGYELIPELQYQPTKNFLIKAGIYLQKEFGRDNYTTVAPTFTAKLLFGHYSFLFGTLEGNLNHRFIEPIYDYKLLFTQRLENGAQLIADTKKYWLDLFINWRKAIHVGDPFREEIDAGLSSRFNLYDKDKFHVDVPVQALITHQGGQISTSPQPDKTLFDFAAGAAISYNFDEFLKKITFENFYVGYRAGKNSPEIVKKGDALLSRVALNFKFFDFDIRYWKGTNFFNPRGGPLYQSVSEKTPGFIEKERQLLLASLIYNKKIFNGLELNLKFTPDYDFGEKILEYYYEFYLKFSTSFFIKNIKSH